MKWTVNMLMGMIIFIVTIGVFWLSINPSSSKTKKDPTPPEQTNEICNSDSDCISNMAGRKCLILNNENPVPFCGCTEDSDCSGIGSGICGEEKCV